MVLTPKPFHSLKGLLGVRTNPILPISSTQEIVTSPTSLYVSGSITNLRPSNSWIRSDSRIVSTHRYSEGSQHPLKWRSMRMGCWIPLSVRIDLITWLTPGSSLIIWIALPPFSLFYLMKCSRRGIIHLWDESIPSSPLVKRIGRIVPDLGSQRKLQDFKTPWKLTFLREIET